LTAIKISATELSSGSVIGKLGEAVTKLLQAVSLEETAMRVPSDQIVEPAAHVPEDMHLHRKPTGWQRFLLR
jgi:hypothetical protein